MDFGRTLVECSHVLVVKSAMFERCLRLLGDFGKSRAKSAKFGRIGPNLPRFGACDVSDTCAARPTLKLSQGRWGGGRLVAFCFCAGRAGGFGGGRWLGGGWRGLGRSGVSGSRDGGVG